MPDDPKPNSPRADLIRAALAFLAATRATGAMIPLGNGKYVAVGSLGSISGLLDGAREPGEGPPTPRREMVWGEEPTFTRVPGIAGLPSYPITERRVLPTLDFDETGGIDLYADQQGMKEAAWFAMALGHALDDLDVLADEFPPELRPCIEVVERFVRDRAEWHMREWAEHRRDSKG